MKPFLSIKTLYRSPVRTLLTFILLGVVMFAFFSQTAEYAVTAREFNNAAKQYCGVGAVEITPPGDPHAGSPRNIYADPRMAETYTEDLKEYYGTDPLRYQPLTGEQIDAISALPYITSTDMRYMMAGISNAYFRPDDGKYFYNYSARCVIEAMLKEVQYGNKPDDPMLVGVNFNFNRLCLEDCKILAGNVPWKVEHEAIMVFADFQKPDEPGGISWPNERAIWFATPSYIYDTEYVKNLMPGWRYIFVIRFEPLMGPSSIFGPSMYLYDHLTEPWCGAVWPLDGAPDDYLETDKFAPLKELVELTDDDAHTFDMVYTDDMGSILRFAEGDMAVLEGRALTPEDSENGSNVCVVSREFAKMNALKVGDTITMKLGTELFEQYKGLGAVAAARERYKPPEKTVTLEIVGIYGDTDGPNRQKQKPNWSYSVSTIFVPKSLLPVDESVLTGHVFSPAEFSFKVENAWDIPAFLDEVAPQFEEMGLKLIFNDDGWLTIANGFYAARQIALIKIAVLAAAVTAATGFVVYLFIGRKKKEYAVMRALGTTRKISARALILPLMSVAVVSVLAGSAAAWIYTVKTITHNNTLSLLKEYAVGTSVPAGAAIGCIVGEILLTLLIARLLLRRIGNLSPLALLQDSGNKQARRRRTAADASGSISPPLVVSAENARVQAENTALSGIPGTIKKRHKSGSFGFVLWYIQRHMRRSAGKSALAILLAALLFIAVGQLAMMKDSYTRLCADTVIKAKFVGGLELSSVPHIIDSGYFINPYYEFSVTADLNSIRTDLVITNNITRYTGEAAVITYAGGYDASVMETLGNFLIVGKVLMEAYGLNLGDTVSVNPESYLFTLQQLYLRNYKTSHPEETITDDEILALYEDEITQQVDRVTAPYVITGVFSTISGKYDRTAFTPGDVTTPRVVGKPIKLDVAEFTLSDNLRADEVRGNVKKIDGVSTAADVYFLMDTSELENLRNTLRLLETMYPIALTAALLIGSFLCCLVIVQSSKEAAIMRIQGTAKRKTRVILALEQMILSVGGLIIGACMLLAYKGMALAVISGQLYVFAALYFAVILVSAITCAGLATRRNVLELLQTKE